jgi:hypothetical protein
MKKIEELTWQEFANMKIFELEARISDLERKVFSKGGLNHDTNRTDTRSD